MAFWQAYSENPFQLMPFKSIKFYIKKTLGHFSDVVVYFVFEQTLCFLMQKKCF